MKTKLIIFVLVLIIFVNVASAVEPTDIFRQDATADIKFSCLDETTGNPCDSSYACNITVFYPDGRLLVDNLQSQRRTSYYNYTVSDSSTLGFYKYQTYCYNGSEGGYSPELYYLINTTGENVNLTKALLYLFALILSCGVFAFCLYFALKIPWDNKRNERGYIMGMNDLKYVKLFLWFAIYLIAIFIFYMAKTVTGLLEVGIATALFNVVFWFLIGFLFPVFVVTVVVAFMKLFEDKKIKQLVERRISIR